MPPALAPDPARLRPRRLVDAAAARASRGSAWVQQSRRWRGYPAERRRAAFVVGCQRSGTSILIETLAEAPEIWCYSEGTNRAFKDYRLRQADRVEAIVRAGPSPITALKPICDSHLTDVLLDQHHGSRAVWIWRDHREVSRSAIVRWGDHQQQVIAALRAGRFHDLGWRGERVSDEALDVLRSSSLASAEDGAVLLWYLRNRFVFDLGLDRDDRVLVLRYEDLVGRPEVALASVFGHLGVEAPASAVAGIRRSSRAPAPLARVSDDVAALASELTDRLVAATPSLVDA